MSVVPSYSVTLIIPVRAARRHSLRGIHPSLVGPRRMREGNAATPASNRPGNRTVILLASAHRVHQIHGIERTLRRSK